MDHVNSRAVGIQHQKNNLYSKFSSEQISHNYNQEGDPTLRSQTIQTQEEFGSNTIQMVA